VKIWVLSPQGKLLPVSVIVGITDGTFSEIVSGDLKEGGEVVVEELSKSKGSNSGSSRPPTMRFGR
jgi:HlyD family secretion protein